MNEIQEQEKIVDPNTATEYKYIKFEVGKRMFVSVKNWRTVEALKTFNGKPKILIVWRADVYKSGTSAQLLDDHITPKIVELSNITFRKSVNTLLAAKDTQTEVLLSIKRIGEAKATTYDVELVQ